ncbi:MAG: isoprenyl transferase [Oligoflexia bacterium]|nr:isoprenyl transferase [Oligoflexia bacterium]
MKIPQHLAIIMDGNGRWAKHRGRPRLFGHIRGSARVRDIVRECGRLGVKYLTLYAFSAENWGRPSDEVSILMRILQKYLVRERKTLMKNDVRLFAIGDLDSLPSHVRNALYETIEITSQNKGLNLTFALSYGSRQELVSAIQKIAQDAKLGVINPQDIQEQHINERLFTAQMPDPELIIRTSGEYRLSNFLMWQAAYSELYITDTLWPDFDEQELTKAFEEFGKRTRRFGLTDDQIKEPLKKQHQEAQLI